MTYNEMLERLDEEGHGLDGLMFYLDELRESGRTNMYGAGSYIETDYGLDRKLARAVLMHWMDTFNTRHPV